MSNGTMAEAPEVVKTGVAFDLEKLSYGDLRRLQRANTETAGGMELLDTVLEKAVIGGLDAIPAVKVKAVVLELMALVTEAMSGKNEPAAPS